MWLETCRLADIERPRSRRLQDSIATPEIGIRMSTLRRPGWNAIDRAGNTSQIPRLQLCHRSLVRAAPSIARITRPLRIVHRDGRHQDAPACRPNHRSKCGDSRRGNLVTNAKRICSRSSKGPCSYALGERFVVAARNFTSLSSPANPARERTSSTDTPSGRSAFGCVGSKSSGKQPAAETADSKARRFFSRENKQLNRMLRTKSQRSSIRIASRPPTPTTRRTCLRWEWHRCASRAPPSLPVRTIQRAKVFPIAHTAPEPGLLATRFHPCTCFQSAA